jgi:hypothetical protein
MLVKSEINYLAIARSAVPAASAEEKSDGSGKTTQDDRDGLAMFQLQVAVLQFLTIKP